MAIVLSEKNRLLLVRLLLVAAALIFLVLLFLISPLREIVFPAQNEQDLALEVDSGALPDEMGADDGEYADASLDESEESAAGSDGDAAGSDDSAAGEEAGGGAEAPAVNRPPVIEEFIIGPIDVMPAVRSGEAIPITFVEQPFWFTVHASDHEGEIIDFEIDASHGLINDIVRPDDNTVQFIWVSPPNSDGLIETTVNATVEVTAVDFSGGRDRAVINLAMVPESSEGGVEPVDPGAAFSVAQTYRATATSVRSGYVNSAGDVRTGTIIVGDDDSNRQYKGYLTFSLVGIAEIAVEDITGAQIVFNAVNSSGDPQTVGEFVDLKVFNYGATLDSSDFAVGGSRFMLIGTGSFTSGSTAQGSLVNQLRSIRTAGGTTLQVKIGLDATTNNNNAWDMYQFNPGNVELVIDYLD
jgi:hypothetical protein